MKKMLAFLFACSAIVSIQGAALPQDSDQLLIRAARDGEINTVKELLQQPGINLNAMDWLKKTALVYAAENGHADVVEALLKAGADPNKLGAGYSALGAAAQNGDKDIVALLLSAKNIDINIKGFLENTPLENAARNGYKDIVQMLLDADAAEDTPKITDKEIATAERLARMYGHTEVADLLKTPVKSAGKRE